MPAASKLCSGCPNLEEIHQIASIGDLVHISRPKSAVYMHELVDLEGNKAACYMKLALEFAHDALELLLRIINLDVFLGANGCCQIGLHG